MSDRAVEESDLPEGNPVTARLASGLEDPELREFIRDWDQLEALVIDLYRAGRARRDQQVAYRGLRRNLVRTYRRWKARLAPYLQELQAEGRFSADPFEAILAARQPGELASSRAGLESLPHARQVLNHFLLGLQGQQGVHDDRTART